MPLGNPAPLGLFAFGMTTLMLMYVEMGWAEQDFEVLLSGYAIFLGGLGQILVGIFELIKGSSFSFAVFISYGAFWLAWAFVFVEKAQADSSFGDASYQNGHTLFLIQWGILTTFFFVITLRKNMCLIVVFALLALTFFLLAAANATGSLAVRRAAGYFGFFTAVGAMYTGLAELVNEEWGRLVLPGLQPLYTPERNVISKENIMKLMYYDKRTNSMFLQFSGLQINHEEDIEAIREAVVAAILDTRAANEKVHVVVDYKNVVIARELEEKYWAMARDIEKKYYLSVRRFHVSSFGTPSDNQVTRRETAITKIEANDKEVSGKEEQFASA